MLEFNLFTLIFLSVGFLMSTVFMVVFYFMGKDVLKELNEGSDKAVKPGDVNDGSK